MKLHRLRKGRYITMINGKYYIIIHSIHWDIYGDDRDPIATAHTLTDARAMLEGIIEGGVII